mgnify:CR=1 FL=1
MINGGVIMKKMYIPFAKDFAFEFYRTNVRSDRSLGLHFHDCLEINYCLSGEGFLLIDEKRFDFHPGEFYFINNLQVHEAVSTDQLRIIVIMFEPSIIYQNNSFDYGYLEPFYPKDQSYSNRLQISDDMQAVLTNLLFDIEDEMQQKQLGYQMMVKAILMRFLGLVYRNLKVHTIDTEKRDFIRQYERLRPVLEYISTHYCQKQFKLEELAQIMHMNKTYFSTFFKKVMQTGVFDYINNLRVEHAASLLCCTNQPVIDVSYECGFENVSYFNKRFKEVMGITPGEYRNVRKDT